MKYFLLILKLVIVFYLLRLAYFLASGYDPAADQFRPPTAIWIADIFNLYIHEAGHFVFKPFGTWIYFLGGSLLQVMLPLALFIVTLRKNPAYAGYAGFWAGESMMNVCVYIKDAPYGRLHLIAKGLTHDWYRLLSGNLGFSEPLGDAVFILALFSCLVSAGLLVFFAIRDFRWYDKAEPSE